MNLGSLDWSLCRSFLAILREGSLSAAARTLDVAHPTVRRHLDELEAALGRALFVRTPAGLIATDLALALREPAEAMEAAMAHLLRAASDDGAGIAGTVRISASEVIGAEVLPPILARLRAAHPALAIELALSNRIENVSRRDADIAVRMARPTQPDVVARRLGVVPLGWFAHESWLAAHGAPQDLAELIAAGALIGYDRIPTLRHALAARGLAEDAAAFGLRTDSDLAQLAGLRAGLGVGVAQLPLAAGWAGIRRVLPEFTESLEIWLVTHPSLRGAGRVAVTLEALAAGLLAYLRGRS